MQNIKRGEIYYIQNSSVVGSEQSGTRPAVVVSNEKANKFSPVIEVVFLTTRRKKNLPTHVPVIVDGKQNTVLCEQITSIDVSRIGTYKGKVNDIEMEKINRSLSISLGIAQ